MNVFKLQLANSVATGWNPVCLILAGAAALAIIAPSAYAQAVSYPRVGVIFAGRQLVSGAGQYVVPPVQDLARYDTLVSASEWGIANLLSNAQVQQLFALNPKLQLLWFAPNFYVNDPDDLNLLRASPEWDEQHEQHYLLRNSSGVALKWWADKIYFFNFAYPGAADFYANFALERFGNQPTNPRAYYAGFYFDGMHLRPSAFLASIGYPDIDADGDGHPDDPATLDASFSAGMLHYLDRLRQAHPNFLLLANDVSQYLDDYKTRLNGTFVENELYYYLDCPAPMYPDIADRCPAPWYDLWDIVNYGVSWKTKARQPPLTIFGMGAPLPMMWSSAFWGANPSDPYTPWEHLTPWWGLLQQVRDMGDRMRFGLGMACLSDAMLSFDWGPTAYGMTYWWYPEYDAGGRRAHYLGQPLGPPRLEPTHGAGNLLTNGSFESGQAGWTLEQHQGYSGGFTVAADPNAPVGSHYAVAYSNQVAPAGEQYRVQLKQTDLHFAAGKEYVVDFYARSPVSHEVVMQVLLDVSPWTNYLWRPIQLGTAWTHYYFTFVSPATTSQGRLTFLLANSTEQLHLDGVELLEDLKMLMVRDFEKGVVYVNPSRAESRALSLGRTLYRAVDDYPLSSVALPPHDAAFLLYQPLAGSIFSDGFERGDTSAWSVVVP